MHSTLTRELDCKQHPEW